ncbi:MAG: T9SS type A sorting domain-containing protein, partial [Bacteroidota bacterium]
VAITRHILGVNLLDSPYKHIAADVDGNREIDVADIINIRRLILGLSDTYPNDMPSWAFVPADYEFAELDNPWAEAFPSVSNFNDLTASVIDADFIGAKLGDVNGSAIANALQPPVPRSLRGDLELELDETEMIEGETYRIPVTAPGLTEVDGYQFTLEFDRTAMTLESIEPGLATAGNFGWRFASSGLITTSWNWTGSEAPVDWRGEEVLFTLVVRAESAGLLSDALEASSRYTEAEAYVRGGTGLRNLSLIFNEEVVEVAGYRLRQNLPNPVLRETTIGFDLPEAHAEVTINVTDAAGRLVAEYKQEGFVGYNSVLVNKRDLGGASGVYSYTVTAGDWVATKRMVLIE